MGFYMDKEIDKLLLRLEELYKLFYMDKEKEAFGGVSEVIGQINTVMLNFIKDIPEFNKKGANIPSDVVIAQLNNFMDALKYKDSIMMGDCIKYELMDSLSFYKELLME